METQAQSTSTDTNQLVIIQRKLFLDNKIRNGIGWFFGIAGLSLVNTVTYLLGTSFTFVVGLGVTQIVDVFTNTFAKELPSGGGIVRLIGFAIDVFIAGIFIAIGVLGRKRYRAPIIIGMVLYAIDGLILLLFQDFLGAGFHAFALAGIWNGFKSISELANLEMDGNSESIESIRKRMPSLQPQVTPQQRKTRWVLVGMIFLVIFLFFVIMSFQQ